MSEKVLLCGVGGQGTILAAHVLAAAIMNSGLDVKVSEIHGMSQRGGAVTTVVNYGENVKSMVSDIGCADIIVSFEMLEALRNIDQLKTGAVLLVNDETIKPASVLTGKSAMLPDMRSKLLDAGAMLIPAQSIADEAGNAKAANIVLLGALSAESDIDDSAWEDAIASHVPPKTKESNLMAFKMGKAFIEDHRSSR